MTRHSFHFQKIKLTGIKNEINLMNLMHFDIRTIQWNLIRTLKCLLYHKSNLYTYSLFNKYVIHI